MLKSGKKIVFNYDTEEFFMWYVVKVLLRHDFTFRVPFLSDAQFTDIPRSAQVDLTRLRLDVCLLTHRHLFSHLPRVTCFCCLCPVTIEHLLLLCPSYVGLRLNLREVCQQLCLTFDVPSLLSPPFPAESLLSYLRATPYLSLL